MEESRQCGWRGERQAGVKAVWARYGSATNRCPKTVITADSVAWLDQWAIWRQTGRGVSAEWSAKDLEAMAVLEQAWERMQHEARWAGD